MRWPSLRAPAVAANRPNRSPGANPQQIETAIVRGAQGLLHMDAALDELIHSVEKLPRMAMVDGNSRPMTSPSAPAIIPLQDRKMKLLWSRTFGRRLAIEDIPRQDSIQRAFNKPTVSVR
jgi:hypothetical protein